MKILTISGRAQHGKDTVANIIKDILAAKGERVLVTHYADLLKYICKNFFDWDGEKDEYGRSLLQYVGTNVIREKAPDFWVDFISSVLQLFDKEWDYVIIPDCRFENEITRLKEDGFDVSHIRVIRTNFESNLTEEQKNHPSETAMDNVVPNYLIKNTGAMERLYKQVEQLIADIREEE